MFLAYDLSVSRSSCAMKNDFEFGFFFQIEKEEIAQEIQSKLIVSTSFSYMEGERERERLMQCACVSEKDER